jgi:hypothetical protein
MSDTDGDSDISPTVSRSAARAHSAAGADAASVDEIPDSRTNAVRETVTFGNASDLFANDDLPEPRSQELGLMSEQHVSQPSSKASAENDGDSDTEDSDKTCFGSCKGKFKRW